MPAKDRIAWEKELTGVYFSPHPMESFAAELADIVTAPCGELGHELVGQEVVVAGMVVSVRNSFTREGRPFVVAELEDMSGSIEVTVWPRVHENTKGLWNEGAVIVVKGQLRSREGQLQISCQTAQRYARPIGGARRRVKPRVLVVEVKETEDTEADIALLAKLVDLLKAHPGEDCVSLVVETASGSKTELDMPDLRVSFGPDLERELGTVLAGACYRLG